VLRLHRGQKRMNACTVMKEEIRWRLGMTAEIIKHGGRA
jgi:hypothetical protein